MTGEAVQKADLNPAQRAGILTHGSFLTKHSKEVESFPIIRGVYVLRQVLCKEIPEPQLELPPAPEQTPGTTTRKLYEDFTAAAACSACHTAINGVGFAFENYDAVGGWRDKEEGQTVDASGKLELASGALSYKNGVEFAKAIAKHARGARLRGPQLDAGAAAAGGAARRGRLAQGHQRGVRRLELRPSGAAGRDDEDPRLHPPQPGELRKTMVIKPRQNWDVSRRALLKGLGLGAAMLPALRTSKAWGQNGVGSSG